jgi:hypothetical protein
VKALSYAALLAVVGSSSTVMAQHTERCTSDDKLLNRTVVAGRNAWARRCGFISQNMELLLNEALEYVVFSAGCYAYPNIRSGSTCTRHVPIFESSACIPLNELYKLGTCPIGYTLAAQKEFEASPAPDDRSPASTVPAGQTIEDVFSLQLANGHELEVPAHVLLVDGEGNLVRARTLAPGDELLGSDGQKVPISDIRVSRFRGYVWNAQPVRHPESENLLDLEGLLIGSAHFQDESARIDDRLVLREEVDVQGL